MTSPSPTYVHLRNGGVSVVLQSGGGSDIPSVLFWGADLGPLTPADLADLDTVTLRQTPPATLDTAWRPSLLPMGRDGWSGRPGFQATSGGHPLFPVWSSVTEQTDSAGHEMSITAVGESAPDGVQLRFGLDLRLDDAGLLAMRTTVTNESGQDVSLDWLDTCMPVPLTAVTMTSFTGRWPLEKQPQTTGLPDGSITRTSRRGKPGHDSPWILLLSDGTPRNGSGAVWASHLAWSGDATYRTDRLPHHQPFMGAGELLGPGEMTLKPGEAYVTPQVYYAFSQRGLDGISDQFHHLIRTMPGRAHSPRPFTLNTWEAVYFDHNFATLSQLATRAAEVGVERFVLDDGWFHERRDDTRGLGDWVVDPEVWPDGLEPLADFVHERGMQFGLWFEPEMVNLDSDVGRAHPEWILGYADNIPNRPDVSYRSQYVLDLANPEAYDHVRGQMAELIEALHVDYIKWDHNRELTEPIHAGVYGTHVQTLAAYRLIDDLKEQFSWLEIESCSSGGARTDVGILEHTDRIWASDSNDPRNRNDIQRWTELIVPPELIGAHVGPSPAHSTGRATDLSYRMAISLEGSAGLEWNILDCTSEEIEQIKRFVALYKEARSLLHSGVVRHSDFVDPALRGRTVIAADRTHAIAVISSVDDLRNAIQENYVLPDAAPELTYEIHIRTDIGATQWGWIVPQWVSEAVTEAGIRISGKLLQSVGLLLPNLWPMQAFVLDITAVER